MRKTAAPSGILLGVLLGMLVLMGTGNATLGVIAIIGLPIVCWNLIRLFETGLAAVISSTIKGISNVAKRRKQAKANALTQSISNTPGAMRESTLSKPATPHGIANRDAVTQPSPFPPNQVPERIYCSRCGQALPAEAKFCNGCGAPVERVRVP